MSEHLRCRSGTAAWRLQQSSPASCRACWCSPGDIARRQHACIRSSWSRHQAPGARTRASAAVGGEVRAAVTPTMPAPITATACQRAFPAGWPAPTRWPVPPTARAVVGHGAGPAIRPVPEAWHEQREMAAVQAHHEVLRVTALVARRPSRSGCTGGATIGNCRDSIAQPGDVGIPRRSIGSAGMEQVDGRSPMACRGDAAPRGS